MRSQLGVAATCVFVALLCHYVRSPLTTAATCVVPPRLAATRVGLLRACYRPANCAPTHVRDAVRIAGIRTAIERCTAAFRTAIRTGASPERYIRTGNSDFFRPIRRSRKKKFRANSALYSIEHYVSPVRIVFVLRLRPWLHDQPFRPRMGSAESRFQ